MKRNIVNHMHIFTAVVAIVLAFAGLADAGVVSKEQPKKAEKAKKGMLIITVATGLQGVTLEPGEYEVKQKNTKDGPVVRFTKYTYNPYAQEGQSVHQWDVVAQVRVTMQPLEAKAERTQLLAGSSADKPVALEIRGNSFQYVFATS